MEHRDVAKRVITAVGGEDNIVGAAHCAVSDPMFAQSKLGEGVAIHRR